MTSIPQGCKRQRFFCRVAWRRVQCANVSAGAAGETLSGEEGTASSFGKTRSPSPSSCLRFGLLPLPSFQLSLCLSCFPPEPAMKRNVVVTCILLLRASEVPVACSIQSAKCTMCEHEIDISSSKCASKRALTQQVRHFTQGFGNRAEQPIVATAAWHAPPSRGPKRTKILCSMVCSSSLTTPALIASHVLPYNPHGHKQLAAHRSSRQHQRRSYRQHVNSVVSVNRTLLTGSLEVAEVRARRR